jgi:hypothetical protein
MSNLLLSVLPSVFYKSVNMFEMFSRLFVYVLHRSFVYVTHLRTEHLPCVFFNGGSFS